MRIAASSMIHSHSVSSDLHGIQLDPVVADILRKDPEHETFVRLKISPTGIPPLPALVKTFPIPKSLVLRVDELTRNVNENHLREIFSNFGEVVHVQLAMDHTVNLLKGFGYVEFKMRVDAEKAQLHMDGGMVLLTREIRSRSRSISPRRGRAPGARHGRSSSNSSPSPWKVCLCDVCEVLIKITQSRI
ncbi:unnamed protein product [Ilex paraguariensis]|uniref:RRM domain-containing protein n=1 Tax=Ilex paraguariensis TaxID=185542 RepID=A0ABC8V2W4_9AQUA